MKRNIKKAGLGIKLALLSFCLLGVLSGCSDDDEETTETTETTESTEDVPGDNGAAGSIIKTGQNQEDKARETIDKINGQNQQADEMLDTVGE